MPRCPPSDSEFTERNAPSVEAAFQEAPEEMVAEIIEGALHLSPRPPRPQAHVCTNLGALLGPPFKFGQGGPGGWIILREPEIHFGPRPDKLVLGLAGWRRERLPGGVDANDTLAHYELVPDWVCEVPSPITRERDQGPKQRTYAREGVRYLWHVDALARTLEVFQLQGTDWHRVESFSGDGRIRAEPFEAIELALALLWSR